MAFISKIPHNAAPAPVSGPAPGMRAALAGVRTSEPGLASPGKREAALSCLAAVTQDSRAVCSAVHFIA